jgi:hypothetical protein
MNTPAIRAAAMRRLWERMVAIYGYRWVTAYGAAAENDAGALTLAAETWRRGLAGVDESALGLGLDACIASADPWPPTLPAFRALCLGVPTFNAVAAELRTMPALPSGFLRLVMGNLDLRRFRLAGADSADRLLRAAYETAREHVMRGGALPPAPVAAIEVEPETLTPAKPETVEACVGFLRSKFGASEPVVDSVIPCPLCDGDNARASTCSGCGGAGEILSSWSAAQTEAAKA